MGKGQKQAIPGDRMQSVMWQKPFNHMVNNKMSMKHGTIFDPSNQQKFLMVISKTEMEQWNRKFSYSAGGRRNQGSTSERRFGW